jgi:phosphoglucomutase
MDITIKDKAQQWLNSNIDEATRSEIDKMLQAESEELTDAFYKDLEFGTGGLRGIMGVGSNRINKYTIGMATQGLANYLLKVYGKQQISVAIAHDSRNNSKFFGQITADVFSANGIKVYFFEDLRPTPELSFAVRHFGCQGGVVITASHNPKEYNGYKVYWNDGAQVTPPHDKNIIAEVQKIKGIDEVKFTRNEALIEEIGKDVDELYLKSIVKLSVSKEAVANQKNLGIVYSPIHGTGHALVPEVLSKMGFTNIHTVEEQSTPDGNFPTVVYPNPEETEALTMALEKAAEVNAELVMATDPDADRVGIAVKNLHNKFQLLNGNQTASLLVYYMLKRWQENKKLTGKQYIVKTIVTTDLIELIAKKFFVECYNTLTGFKYIAAIIRKLEGEKEFIVGGEESYGYLISDFVRDKDAIASCAMIAEMAAYAKDKGHSLFEMLVEIYQQFGFYKEHLINITKTGKKGAEEIENMMHRLRNNPPAKINNCRVVKVMDYQIGKSFNKLTGEETKINLPASNVLQFVLEDDTKISARPSGTEPKIKFYISVNEKLLRTEDYDSINMQLDARIKAVAAELEESL